MKRFWMAAAWLALGLAGCAKTEDPLQGSQTHFLDSCDARCPSPFECICGVCTLECSVDAMCGEHAEAATCVGVANQSCGTHLNVCDVSCDADNDCSMLGAGFACDSGRCREDAPIGDGDGDGDASQDDRGRLCDGSTDMRLGYTSEGGQLEVTYDFTNPYGHAFFFVDGQCNYYVSTGHLAGIATGTLTDDQASALEQGVEWSAIDELAAEIDDESCPDAGTVTIWAPQAQVACTCGCEETAVGERKSAALQAIYDLALTLMDQGRPLDTPVLAIASPNDGIADATTWPLERAIDAVPSLVHDVFADGVDEFAVLDREADARALRQLRAAAQAGRLIAVSDAGGTFELYMRDAFPPGVRERIDALRGISTAVDPELGPICDGSDEIRIGLTTPMHANGGPTDEIRAITHRYYGHGYLYVDGHCDFYASRGYSQGTSFGTIREADARSLEMAMQWQALGRMSLTPDEFTCVDGGSTTVQSPRAQISCDCECDGAQAEELSAVITEVDYWIGSVFWPTFPQLETPVRAIAFPQTGEPLGLLVEWTLDRPIADYEGLSYGSGGITEGILFEDPAELATLRDLRRLQPTDQDGLYVEDGEGWYILYIVDQLPPDVELAIDRFKSDNR